MGARKLAEGKGHEAVFCYIVRSLKKMITSKICTFCLGSYYAVCHAIAKLTASVDVAVVEQACPAPPTAACMGFIYNNALALTDISED